MEDDASHFHDVINALADEGKDVVIVAHSYGGIVANQCAQGLLKTDRAAFGKPGGVVRVVFITCIVPALGCSTSDTTSDIRFDGISVQGDYMTLDAVESAKMNFSDLPLDEAVKFSSHATMHSALSFAGKLSYAAYEHVAVSYIICEKDACLPPTFQQDRIKLIEEKSGNKVDTRSINAGHFPPITRPEELAGLIQEAIIRV
ncbi:hypothetical protein AWENTII_009240 [Aspergillus wentii]